MIRTILILFIWTGSIGISFGQLKIIGGVYNDTTLADPIKKVKLILTSDNYKKTFKTDKKGKFKILIKNPNTDFSLEIKKKGYITYRIDFDKSKSDIEFDVVLRKSLSMHDKGYEGESEIIRRN